MPVDKLRPSFTFTEDRLAELRTVVPEAFADGAVNWEALRDALGAHLEDEGRDAEHFGLTWPGKRQARRLAAQPSKGTLLPISGEGVDEASTYPLQRRWVASRGRLSAGRRQPFRRPAHRSRFGSCLDVLAHLQ